jgi:hypothetical protein
MYALFFVKGQDVGQQVAKVLLGGVDTLLGWALKAIVYYLFPPNSKREA